MKTPTQIDVVEQMLLNENLVTASTVYNQTKKIAKLGSVNHHKIIASLRKKYKIKDYWCVDKKGNRYKYYEIV